MTAPAIRTGLLNLGMLVVMTVLVSDAAPAEAQIHTWHDETGRLVLSNQRPGQELRTFAIPDAALSGTTQATPISRARWFDDLITEHASRGGVRADLVRAVMQVESGFNPNARSPKGAMGLMQLMPATARDLGVDNPFNPAENIRGGVTYLRYLLDRYGNNEELALAAYNAGPGAVDRYGERVPPYRETKDYVLRIGRVAGTRVIGAPVFKVYRVVEVIDGREVAKYSDRKR